MQFISNIFAKKAGSWQQLPAFSNEMKQVLIIQ